MMKTLKIIFLFCSMSLSFKSISQNHLQQSHFAIGFFTSAHSQLITYAFVKTINGKVIGAEVVSQDRFIHTALGHWPHPVNNKREDIFVKNNIDSCFLLRSESNKVIGYYAPIFDHLWKIRFYEHPYQYDQMGWSKGQYKPSAAQSQFLRETYGLNNFLSDYIYGDSLFKLLRDVQSPGWVSLYKTASLDTTTTP